MTQIMALGEVLIDLTQTGTDAQGIPQFAAFPGGAPANVAVAASRLGAQTAFLGVVGDDSYGQYLRRTLENEDVDAAGLLTTAESPTTLAIVSVDETGERSFAFYRQPGADTRLTSAEAIRVVDEIRPQILHFGSLSLTTEPSRTAALEAAAHAKAGGALISYDPNFRPALWSDPEEAVRWMNAPLDMVDVLKVSDEEMVMMTGTEDPEAGTQILADHGIRLVLVTLGSKGVFYRCSGCACEGTEGGCSCEGTDGGCTGTVPGVRVTVSDTNGAGDTFLGAVLMQLAQRGDPDETAGTLDLSNLSQAELESFLRFANQAAAKTCSRPGAIPAMPTREEVEAELNS